MNKRVLEIALAKAQHFDGRVWCGAFTPAEILALVEDGARPEHPEHWESYKKHYEDDIKKGISYQAWFYFEKKGLVKNEQQ